MLISEVTVNGRASTPLLGKILWTSDWQTTLLIIVVTRRHHFGDYAHQLVDLEASKHDGSGSSKI
jgi:hypothetical protein